MIEALRDRRVVAIAACGAYSMVLTDEGEVLSFGGGEDGQLGHGDRKDQLVPKVIEALRGMRVVAMALGSKHSMVLIDEGIVLSFGSSTYAGGFSGTNILQQSLSISNDDPYGVLGRGCPGRTPAPILGLRVATAC